MLPPPVTWQRRICNTKEKIDRARSVSCPSHCGSNVGGRARRRASGTKDSEPVFACDTHPPLERPAIVTRSRAELHSVLRVPPVAGRILVSCIGPVNDSKPHSDCGTHAVLDPRSLPAFAARSVRRGASPFIRGALHLRSFAARCTSVHSRHRMAVQRRTSYARRGGAKSCEQENDLTRETGQGPTGLRSQVQSVARRLRTYVSRVVVPRVG